jgi:hypothetical protein
MLRSFIQYFLFSGLLLSAVSLCAQRTDTLPPHTAADSSHHLPLVSADSTEDAMDSTENTDTTDAVLRITNLSPYITLHVDSTLQYRLELNHPGKFFWYLRNAPVGLRIDKNNGTLRFKADKNFFLSGQLIYDKPYPVVLGVQNSKERIDTSFTILFYNTEIIPSRIKPSVSSQLQVDEGDTVSFRLQCENGSFPIEHINFFANRPLKNVKAVQECGDEFFWVAPYDFVKPTDSGKVQILTVNFVGVNRFQVHDTATVRIIVRDALNYPQILAEWQTVATNITKYLLRLKYTFIMLDKKVKNGRGTRTSFDITSSSTALTGTILSSSADPGTQHTGQILPAVGLSLVPIKEAVSPQRTIEQNQASMVRSAIKRLEFMVQDNRPVGEKDPDIVTKTGRLRDELKQSELQLVDVPIELSGNMSEEELNRYFNNPRVQKKYRLKP